MRRECYCEKALDGLSALRVNEGLLKKIRPLDPSSDRFPSMDKQTSIRTDAANFGASGFRDQNRTPIVNLNVRGTVNTLPDLLNGK